MPERPEWDTDANYDSYCRMIAVDHPGLLPATREGWVAFNLAMEEIDARESRPVPTSKTWVHGLKGH